MKFRDDFAANFLSQEKFMEFLDQVETNAQWENYPTNTIMVFSAEEKPGLCDMIPAQESKEKILKDTYANTGLLLKVGETYYPVGSTTIKTLENRARISGNALQDLERAKFASVINDCLQVTKGQALIRIHEGKVRAVHGGDKSDYAVLSMPELFEVAALYMRETYDRVKFSKGYFSHLLTTASWEIRDGELLDCYRELLLQYGQSAPSELSAVIRVDSSDVAASGANIFCSLLEGPEKRPLILGNALKLEHSGAATIEAFAGNVAQIFARHRETVEGLGKLFHVYVNYPANVMAGLMNRVGIGKQLTAQTVEQFKAGHMGGGCSGYEVYCGICECIFLAQSRGMSVKGLLDLEEMVSRILTYRMHDYDIPGVVSY